MAHAAATLHARLREAILCHVWKYPLAADTAEGILGCWVPQTGFEGAQEQIGAVLEDMVAAGWLQARRLPDGKILYARGPACN